MWAQRSLSPVRGNYSGIGERVSLGGRGALGFAIEAAGDPDVWTKLTADQQMWVSTTLNTLNNQIVVQSGTSCPTWGPAINLAGGCFQAWYNKNYGASGASKSLRSDGVFDQDTLDALIMIAGLRKKDFPTPFPGGAITPTTVQPVSAPAAAPGKLSTGAMVGIGVAGAAALGGIVYAATSGHKSGRRKRRR